MAVAFFVLLLGGAIDSEQLPVLAAVERRHDDLLRHFSLGRQGSLIAG